MISKTIKTGTLALALSGCLTAAAQAQAPAPQLFLDGKPLPTSTAPITQNGRLLVPLRDIFEALGAKVEFSSLTQTIGAQRGTTTVTMALGSRAATVNGLKVTLDAPATAYSGRTMVPLRFVSEALGAKVNFDAYTSVVNINSGEGQPGPAPVPVATTAPAPAPAPGGTPVIGFRDINIPVDTVVPVKIDQALSSGTARVGQTFTATVDSRVAGDSEFPAGTRLEGEVVEVSAKSGDNPGVLDLHFRAAILSDGTRVPLDGSIVSMDSESYTNDKGRLVAKTTKKKNDTLKVVGIGAAAGFVLGKVIKKDGALPTILGALGGLIYDKSQKKTQTSEAQVAPGARFGVRLDAPVTYRDTTNYYDKRKSFRRL